MELDLNSQVKGIINIILTIMIAVAATFVVNYPIAWLVIISCGLIQIYLSFIPSVEKKHYSKYLKHMEELQEWNRKIEKATKSFEYSQRIRDLERRAQIYGQRISKGDTQYLIDSSVFIKNILPQKKLKKRRKK